MHPSFQERIDELGVLLQKTHAARIEFFERVDQAMPPKKVRFQVKAVGEAYHIVDLTSGKTKAFRWTYKAAMDIAMQFEEKANRPAGGVQ
ncbi:hypothetical protein [Pseudomonas frederiksbergensis]|uniref:Uncharacterized protein n=1 Tax=Pseudomonas frederiksbergensis TaxID=104087 RepID=A0A0B1YVF6_9PSED|nr:hypothetical protein [Pseudomonas frederiksbergensis]KHK61162.1 hypothetical protein JZ00_30155 [Pseudomonas frederiksbergensis]